MISPWLIYLISILDGINLASFSLLVISFILLYITGIVELNVFKKYRKLLYVAIIGIVISSLFLIFVPSTKDAARIVLISTVENNAQINDECLKMLKRFAGLDK